MTFFINPTPKPLKARTRFGDLETLGLNIKIFHTYFTALHFSGTGQWHIALTQNRKIQTMWPTY